MTTQANVYRCRPISLHKIGSKAAVINVHRTNVTAILPYWVADFLQTRTQMQSLEDHAIEYWANCKGRKKIHVLTHVMQFCLAENHTIPLSFNFAVPLLKRCLEILEKSGFLISLRDFATPSLSSLDTPPPITTIGILTKDRRDALARGLVSYIKNVKNHRRSTGFVIFDDSENRELIEDLKKIKREHGVSVRYSGKQEKEDYVRHLISLGISDKIANFGLFGGRGQSKTFGANRNAFLLNTVSELAFMADDDTICSVRQLPNTSRGIQIGSKEYPIVMKVFSNREDVLNTVPDMNVDFLKLHELTLGRHLGQIIAQNNDEPISTAFMSGEVMKSIMDQKSRVMIALNGLVGDSGMGDSNCFLFAQSVDRDDLLASEARFNEYLNSREMTKAVPCLTLIPARPFMTTFTSLDNRNILPPFFPFGRGEDSLFGLLVGRCLSGSMTSYLPQMLVHSPADKRLNVSEEANEQITVSPQDLIAEMVRQWAGEADGDGRKMMGYLGAGLIEIASEPHAEFLDRLLDYQTRSLSRDVADLETLIVNNPKGPTFWIKRLKESSNELAQLAKKTANTSVGIAEAPEIPGLGPLKSFQAYLSSYGELLIHWDEIIKAAKTLKQGGIEPSSVVD